MSRDLYQPDPTRRLEPPVRGPGKRLPADTLGRMERAFGTDLEDIRVHDGSEGASLARSEAASAVAWRNHIAVAEGEGRSRDIFGDLLLAHEIAHSLQQRAGKGAEAVAGEAAAEENAEHAARQAVRRDQGGAAPPAGGSVIPTRLGLRRCGGRRRRVVEALRGERAWTPALARDAFDEYRDMDGSERQDLFRRYFNQGTFHSLLRALPAGDRAEYNREIQDILQRAQRAGVLEAAQAAGLASEADLAQTQADFMLRRNEELARRARPVEAPPPTQAEVAAQQTTQVAQTSIAPQSTGLSAADEREWTRRAEAAVPRLVAYARAHHPDLNLTEAHIVVAVRRVHDRGRHVLAFGEHSGGRHVAVVGRTFAELVEANPAYALDTIVHEVFGHPEYGPYGESGSEYGLVLYDLAAARMPGYTRPAAGTEARRSEIDAYAYQETEIYSLLRQLPYNVPLAPAHAGLHGHPDPEQWVTGRVARMKRQWEPRVVRALLRGMVVRFRMDPRLAPQALEAFERAIRANFTGPEAAVAEEILR